MRPIPRAASLESARSRLIRCILLSGAFEECHCRASEEGVADSGQQQEESRVSSQEVSYDHGLSHKCLDDNDDDDDNE